MDEVLSGLSEAEVRARIHRGEVNTLPARSGKTVGSIIRTNVFTRINAILGVLLALVLSTGSWINCAFGLLIVVNSAIGIIQELRAKHTLDSLSVIGEEHPRVVRDGVERELPQDQIVLADVIAVGAGRQIVVDGEVLVSDYLSVDESLLTGEADPVHKNPGDTLLSGSFVVAGSGFYRVTAVGADSYAARLTQAASAYTLSKSHLQRSIDAILRVITWILIPVAVAAVISQIAQGVTGYRETVLAITGALVPMVPEGLILITSTAFALGVIRLGKRKCLVQELPAIEGLARVDVVCADKTGTLTEGTMELIRVEPVGAFSADESQAALAHVLATDPDRNATAEAIFSGLNTPKFGMSALNKQGLDTPSDAWNVVARLPFSSAYKYSATEFSDSHGTWLLGAPDVLVAPDSHAGQRSAELASQGMRVLALVRTEYPLPSSASISALPSVPSSLGESHGSIGTSCVSHSAIWTPGSESELCKPVALIVLGQAVRPDAEATLNYFRSQNVHVKVISGDNPISVAAVTAQLGIDDPDAVDARTLDGLSSEEFAAVINNHSVFGRVRPDQKQNMVAALQASGHTVAMTGDGVNDVLALKNADIGVAMGSGSSASRSVAKLVLLDNRFATLPYVVAEGRRVIGNIERVANLFLTKTTYSALLAVLVVAAGVPFPFQPIHVTITGWFTIGLPAFVLSLPPNNARARSGFTQRVLSFAIPSGVIVAVSCFVTYLITSKGSVPDHHIQQSTAALLALIIPSVWVLTCVARPWNWWKVALFVTPVLGYAFIFLMPITQHFFLLDSSNSKMMMTAIVVGGIGAACVESVWRTVGKRLATLD